MLHNKRRTNEMRMNDIFQFCQSCDVKSIQFAIAEGSTDKSNICAHSCAKIFRNILARRCVLDENSITAPFLISTHFRFTLLISDIRYSFNVTNFSKRNEILSSIHEIEKLRVSTGKQSMHGRIKNYINCVISLDQRDTRAREKVEQQQENPEE